MGKKMAMALKDKTKQPSTGYTVGVSCAEVHTPKKTKLTPAFML
ncbi:MAG: hypothetical protein WDZ47_00325 [Bacteroidales bacterium]